MTEGNITEIEKLGIVNSLMRAIAAYTRFISEADQAGAFHEGILSKISGEMDLPVDNLKELIAGSTETFDEMKASIFEADQIMKGDLK